MSPFCCVEGWESTGRGSVEPLSMPKNGLCQVRHLLVPTASRRLFLGAFVLLSSIWLQFIWLAVGSTVKARDLVKLNNNSISTAPTNITDCSSVRVNTVRGNFDFRNATEGK